MKKEYIIVGSNNFWYASCISNKKEALERARDIMEETEEVVYRNPEALGDTEPETPETLYIYKAEQVEQIERETED